MYVINYEANVYILFSVDETDNLVGRFLKRKKEEGDFTKNFFVYILFA